MIKLTKMAKRCPKAADRAPAAVDRKMKRQPKQSNAKITEYIPKSIRIHCKCKKIKRNWLESRLRDGRGP